MALKLRDGFKDAPTTQWGEYVGPVVIDLTGANPYSSLPRDIFEVIGDRNGTTAWSNPIDGTRIRVTDASGNAVSGGSVSGGDYMSDRLGNNHYWSTYGIGTALVIDFDADSSGRRISPTGLLWQHNYNSGAYRVQYFTVSGGNGPTVNNVTWQTLATVSDPNFLSTSNPAWSNLLTLAAPSDPIQFVRLTLDGTDSNGSQYLNFAEILWQGVLYPGEGGF